MPHKLLRSLVHLPASSQPELVFFLIAAGAGTTYHTSQAMKRDKYFFTLLSVPW